MTDAFGDLDAARAMIEVQLQQARVGNPPFFSGTVVNHQQHTWGE